MQAEDIATTGVFNTHTGLPHNLDDIKISGKADADKKRGKDIFCFFQYMAIFATGVLDGDDLAAGTKDPKDFPAEFMRVRHGGDDVGSHDGIKTIIWKFEVAGIHDVKFNFMTVLMTIQSLAGFFYHTF